MKVEVDALRALNQFLEAAPETTLNAASLAMNTIIPRKGMARYKKTMKSQIGFPAGYLDEADKFGVTTYARPDDLTAAITARQRPTSLARFATSGAVGGGEGVTVKVKAGSSARMKRAFLVRLRAGTSMTGENYNVGVAVRKPGGLTKSKKHGPMVQLSKDVFLLYGPSVDQVFQSVSVTETPHVLNEIETEFYRQFARLS